jgi:hypothetical protein
MMQFIARTGRFLLGSAVALTLYLPGAAEAQTCNAQLAIAVNPGGPTDFGDLRTVTLTMGAGGIVGGTQLTINAVQYNLDCDDDSPLVLPCDDQGDIFDYQGDASITSDCGTCSGGSLNAGEACAPAGPGGGCDLLIGGDNLGTCVAVTWTSNVPAGGFLTNELIFTPSSPLVIDANAFPVCDLEFDVQLNDLEPYAGPDSDSDPLNTAVVAGFASGGDAVCDNAMEAVLSEVAFIPLAPLPACGDLTIDPGETCDPPASIPALPPGNVNECRLDCTYCGDGILQAPETCDTGGVPNRSCNANCTGRIARDPATITFNVRRTTLDRLQVNGLIDPGSPFDLTGVPVGVRLSNPSGLIYEQELPAGSMIVHGRKQKYKNRHAKDEGGFTEFQVHPHRAGFRMKLVTYGDLELATVPRMTVEVYFGSQRFVHTADWKKTKNGWRDTGHTELEP